ncbi:MAG TPA: DoxX family protein [Flavilitoribacter sp.]|nr:DoxX family protein [Flavilitoribacter sp.]HMQ89388.1 DoxX family protein [Flavilitoribacter sp.]
MRIPFSLTPSQSLTLLRVAVSLYMVAHGCTRLYAGTVDGFGEFLGSKGIPLGHALAWVITFFEIAGGITLALGYFRKWINAVFILELLMGIILVHAPNGWFTVGYSSGGMEYSVLLILCFLATAADY